MCGAMSTPTRCPTIRCLIVATPALVAGLAGAHPAQARICAPDAGPVSPKPNAEFMYNEPSDQGSGAAPLPAYFDRLGGLAGPKPCQTSPKVSATLNS